MVTWAKEEIELQGGAKALAQMPVIVSASRSTDIPAFYSDWFMERLKAGYVKWFNPFNGQPLYVGFGKMRCIVFWSKNPKPMLAMRIVRLDSGFIQRPPNGRSASLRHVRFSLLVSVC